MTYEEQLKIDTELANLQLEQSKLRLEKERLKTERLKADIERMRRQNKISSGNYTTHATYKTPEQKAFERKQQEERVKAENGLHRQKVWAVVVSYFIGFGIPLIIWFSNEDFYGGMIYAFFSLVPCLLAGMIVYIIWRSVTSSYASSLADDGIISQSLADDIHKEAVANVVIGAASIAKSAKSISSVPHDIYTNANKH